MKRSACVWVGVLLGFAWLNAGPASGGGCFLFEQSIKSFGIDLAYAHLFVKDSKINKSGLEPEDYTRGALRGDYDANVNIISAQVSWRFRPGLEKRQIVLSETRAEVLTKVITPSNEIPINYEMILAGGIWKIYDVVVEIVSLVINYRGQFRDIPANHTPAQMLEILENKVKK